MTTPTQPLSADNAGAIASTTPGITNTEPGYANTYLTGTDSPAGWLAAGLPALGVGGLGLLMLYRRHLQDEEERKRQLKTASWQDIKAQLPGFHAKDMLLGGALGGGAGLLYDSLAQKPKDKSRLRTALRRALTGAAIGAGGANLLGDRLRRYITNVKTPFSYGTDSILPQSFRQFWDAAVLDKPSFNPQTLDKLVQDNPNVFADREALDTMLAARRELNRRSFGVHSNNAATDVWQKNKGDKGPDYYSLNEQNKNYLQHLQTLFFPSGQPNRVAEGLFENPGETLHVGNTNSWLSTGLFGADSLLGGQQVIAKPTGDLLRPTYKGRVLDRYDMTPSAYDKKHLAAAALRGDIFRPSWRGAVEGNTGYTAVPNGTRANSTLLRMLWDNWLSEERPWVSQNFTMAPQADGKYELELNRESGEPTGQILSGAP